MSDEDQTDDGIEFDRRTALKGGAAGLAALGLGGLATGSAAASSGANKVFSGEAKLEQLDLAKRETSGDAVTLMSGTFDTGDNADIVINATAEVGLYTEIKTKGNDSSVAKAGVECWVELDGEPVAYPPIDGGTLGTDFTGDTGTYTRENEGSVVFNNREFGLKTSDFDDLDAKIELFIRTRSSHGFNWYATDIGKGEHTLALKANISQYVDGKGEAKALVGPRSLIAQPVNMGST
ncbi:MAG: hypothetical protein ABEJ06_03550 [Haloarculaceae archaeon]